jgi:hypothetical protein
MHFFNCDTVSEAGVQCLEHGKNIWIPVYTGMTVCFEKNKSAPFYYRVCGLLRFITRLRFFSIIYKLTLPFCDTPFHLLFFPTYECVALVATPCDLRLSARLI